jgi:hypothetical protein
MPRRFSHVVVGSSDRIGRPPSVVFAVLDTLTFHGVDVYVVDLPLDSRHLGFRNLVIAISECVAFPGQSPASG